MIQAAGDERGETAGRPLVSVIVPARNEEACLAACLASLTAQAGIAHEILLVDDGSTDATRSIAESFSEVQVLTAGLLAPGNSGKCNAVQCGASVARGEWLLFTDADTVHEPGSLARAVAEAEQHRVELLSYSPRQQVRGFWEKAVMPVVFAELAGRYRPGEVCDPDSPVAAANGQYLLVRREAYDAIGGHAAVARTLLEDVELARAVKRSGRRIRFRYGGDAVCARMYRSYGDLRDGWSKNLALLFPDASELAFKRAAEFSAVLAGLVLGTASLVSGRPGWTVGSFALAGLVGARVVSRTRRAKFGLAETLMSPLGLPMFAYLLLRSEREHRGRGSVSWKGRTYQGQKLSGTEAPARLHGSSPECKPVMPRKVKHDGLFNSQV